MGKVHFFLNILGFWVLALTLPAQAHEAHEHGVAKVNIAVEGAQVSIDFESPTPQKHLISW